MSVSSTQTIPESRDVPRHVAVIMDGNGRWAKKRFLPRVAGHAKGVDAVRATVEACARQGVECLTLFAFSSENWRRPVEEVSVLMRLFLTALDKEVGVLRKNGIRLKVIGDLSAFDPKLQTMIAEAERDTAKCPGMTLAVAANYGGRWDILNATRTMLKARPDLAAQPTAINEADLAPYLALADQPEPDLFIRTGGEHRVSNFLLWQLAYTEFYFTDCFWPDFNAEELGKAFESFKRRERRFGRTSEQLGASSQDSAIVSAASLA
jgi:undecaprenyl diphosphate synthase